MTPDKDDHIGALLRLAGERDVPSPAGTARARAAAEAAWLAGRRSADAKPLPRSRRLVTWALAAGIVALAVGGAWHFRTMAPVTVARVAAVAGGASLGDAGGEALVPGANLPAGAKLDTTNGRVALALGALSLRVDVDSRLRFDAPDRVTLLAGRIYVDSGGVNASTALRITTPAGTVRHLGTQFQVAVAGAVTQIQVREGRVALEGRVSREVAAGEMLEVRGVQWVVNRAQPSHGESWDWTSETAPAFDMENRPLAEFVTWIAREHGWQVRYADAGLQARAQEIRLHGSLDGLDAGGMVERVALITGTPMVLRDGALTIGGAAP